MGIFIIGVAVAVGAITMGFEQGQANPQASGFFDSKSTTTGHYDWLGDSN